MDKIINEIEDSDGLLKGTSRGHLQRQEGIATSIPPTLARQARLITPSVVSERLKVNGSVARQAIRHLEDGLGSGRGVSFFGEFPSVCISLSDDYIIKVYISLSTVDHPCTSVTLNFLWFISLYEFTIMLPTKICKSNIRFQPKPGDTWVAGEAFGLGCGSKEGSSMKHD